MKSIPSLLALMILLQFSASAQIVVEPYEKQIRVNINNLSTIMSPVASSKAGEVSATYSDQKFSGGCLGTLVRTYSFKDDSGATATADLYITLEDTDAPIFENVPADIEVAASAIPAAINPVASDNSNEDIEILFTENKEGSVIIRAWTAIDACGNQTIATQRISVKSK